MPASWRRRAKKRIVFSGSYTRHLLYGTSFSVWSVYSNRDVNPLSVTNRATRSGSQAQAEESVNYVARAPCEYIVG